MEYFDLGTYSRPVSTSSPVAQQWFDRGLIWCYGFNHEEAVRCFARVVEADPGCAMGYWGMAFASGPNYNKSWELFEESELADAVARTDELTRQAQQAAATATPVERALIEASAERFPAGRLEGDGSDRNLAYANAMRTVYERFPDDPDVATLFADALMNVTPWALWDQHTCRPAAGAFTLEAKAALDRTLGSTAGHRHPGALHMYIHLMEMSPTPEDALPEANRLRGLVPDSGHLEHMPTHLDILCGDYEAVVSSNSAAIAADDRYVLREGAFNTYTLYRAHNLHFKIYGAMFLGRLSTALETVAQLEDSIPEDLLRVRVPPMADWLESFASMRVHVLIRFGQWQSIIDLPMPSDAGLYCVTTAMLHYAKGVAFSATDRVAEAAEQQQLLRAARNRVPESRTLFNNTCRDILAVAEAMLDGELEYRKGNYDTAFESLRRAIDLDDNLPYDEPWGWMQPVRHAYGALLLEQGDLSAAEAVYRADLGLDDTLPRASRHPANVWSLHGYHECLQRLGKLGEAEAIAPELAAAIAHADVPITASCYCRTTERHCCD
ncbi:hypothetical protein AB0N05_05940 [Nocardia sp. NPDC051030]|uniref:tetratricopeptide repeat protein n=1 Tax=Nocardia sp. NPDC051030 TaxID=3155162 RepID=UPI003432D756